MDLTEYNSLIYSGGGDKGAWTVGATQAIVELGKLGKINQVIGTSTGALISAMVGLALSTGDMTYFYDLVDIYKRVQQGNVLNPRDSFAANFGLEGMLVSSIIYGRPSLYDIDPLSKLIDEYMSENWGKIIDSEIEIGFCATSLEEGSTVLFTNKTHPDSKILKSALMASASQPVLMGPIEIEGSTYVDGGLIDFVPVKYTKGNAICFSTQKLDVKNQGGSFNSTITQLLRSLEIMTESAYLNNRNAAEVLSCRHNYKFLWFEPSDPIEGDGLKFEQPKMRDLLARGFVDGYRQLIGV